jgi:sugar lactone lactonase YvrE
LNNPQGIAVAGDVIFVSDVASPDGNFGIGRVIQIKRRSGAQTIVSEGGHLAGPVGVAVDGDGSIVVGDPYTTDPAGADPYTGAVIRIDPLTGDQTVLARGQDGFVNPRGIAVVPFEGPAGQPAGARLAGNARQ